MSILLKEAYARMQGDSEPVEITKNVRERFGFEHVGRCARGMSQRLSGSLPYLRNVLDGWLKKGKHPDLLNPGILAPISSSAAPLPS